MFSSGGPRGFVHVGVLKALDELGLLPDVILGASVGAVVGALRAAVADDSTTVQGLQRALDDVARAARAVRELSDAIEQQPQSLIRGRPAAP